MRAAGTAAAEGLRRQAERTVAAETAEGRTAERVLRTGLD